MERLKISKILRIRYRWEEVANDNDWTGICVVFDNGLSVLCSSNSEFSLDVVVNGYSELENLLPDLGIVENAFVDEKLSRYKDLELVDLSYGFERSKELSESLRNGDWKITLGARRTVQFICSDHQVLTVFAEDDFFSYSVEVTKYDRRPDF